MFIQSLKLQEQADSHKHYVAQMENEYIHSKDNIESNIISIKDTKSLKHGFTWIYTIIAIEVMILIILLYIGLQFIIIQLIFVYFVILYNRIVVIQHFFLLTFKYVLLN